MNKKTRLSTTKRKKKEEQVSQVKQVNLKIGKSSSKSNKVNKSTRNKKSPSTKKMTSRERMAVLREQFRAYQDEANERLKALSEHHLAGESFAVIEAKQTKSKAKGQSNKLFDIDSQKSFKQLSREISRIESFLSNSESDRGVINARKEIMKNRWESVFPVVKRDERGNIISSEAKEFYEKFGVTYDLSKIDEANAKVAFRIYRDLEESGSSYLNIKGMNGYGSDNLIYLIADMVVQQNVRDYDKSSKVAGIKDDVQKILLEAGNKSKIAGEEEYLTGDEDIGMFDMSNNGLFETMHESQTAIDFISRLNF